jgi:hypothetical protein
MQFSELRRTEKVEKLWKDMQTAMSWDSAGGKWEYTFNTAFKRICTATWVAAYGISWSTFYKIKREVEDAANTARAEGALQVGPRLMGVVQRGQRNTSNAKQRVIAWLGQYAETMGEKLPTPLTGARLDDEEDESLDSKCDIRLPHGKKEDVYEEYRVHCLIHGESCASTTYFLKIWRKEVKHVKCSKAKGSFSMCDICASCTGNMKRASTAAEYEKWKGKRDTHFALQREQRRVYYVNRLRAQTHPSEVLSMIIDAMDQKKTELPVMYRKKKKDANMQFIKQKIMAVIAHGHGRYLYAAHPPLPTGANFTIECLWRTLMKLEGEHSDRGECLPKRLILQMDNASDNKAVAMLAFASHLVEEGVFEGVELNFLIVGHTHEDIDQMFSVISTKLRKLVHSSSSLTLSVVSFDDFKRVVEDAFTNPKFKPRCVEKVHANHDFTSWFAPFKDASLSHITKFRHFKFEVVEGDVADGKAAMKAKEYMSYPDSKYKPNEADAGRFGHVMVLTHGPVTGEPILEEFKDLAIAGVGRYGVPNTLPPAYQDKDAAEILEIKKREWTAWVDDSGNGASEEQKRMFKELLRGMAASVADLPDDIKEVLPQWRLPRRVYLRGALPVVPDRLAGDIMGGEGGGLGEPPSPRLAYGNLSSHHATEGAREYARKARAQAELAASLKVAAPIKKGEVLLIKNIPESGDEVNGFAEAKGEGGVQWWLGISEGDYEEGSREEVGQQEVVVQWMYPKVGRGQAPISDMNAKFTPWLMPVDKKGGKRGPKNRKNSEAVVREAVVLIGVELKGDGEIKRCSKIAIADLNIGYRFDSSSTSTLIYEPDSTLAM